MNRVQVHRDFVRNGEFNTVSLPFDISQMALTSRSHPFSGATIYEMVDAQIYNETIEVTVSQVNAIRAGYPYLIKWDDRGDVLSNPTFTSVSVSVDGTTQYSKTSRSGLLTMYGNLAPIEDPLCLSNTIYLFDGNPRYYWACTEGNVVLKGFRGYFLSEDDKLISPDKTIVIGEEFKHEDPTTGWMDVADGTSEEVRKVIENGHVVIIKNGVKYSIVGEKLEQGAAK